MAVSRRGIDTRAAGDPTPASARKSAVASHAVIRRVTTSEYRTPGWYTRAVTARKLFWVHVCLLLALAFVLSWPVWFHGAPDLAHDTPEHAVCVRNFAKQFWQGDLYPRWLSDSNAGLGSPFLFFYPPLPSYVAALVWPMVHDHDPYGTKLDGLTLGIGMLLSGVAAYVWLRSFAGAKSALAGAAVYVLAPYHVAIDLYTRAGLPEFWIFVWLPLVLRAAGGIVQKERWALPSLAVTYALAIFSHPTIAMVFGAVVCVYAIVFAEPVRRIRSAVMTAGGLALGVGLSATLLAPAIFEQANIHAEQQTSDYTDFHRWWLFSLRDQIDQAGSAQAHLPVLLGFKARLLFVTVTALLLAAAMFLIARTGRKKSGVTEWFWLGICAAFFALMLRQSAFVWEHLPGLKFIQFPNRLNTMIVIAAAALTALAAPYLWTAKTRLLTLGAASIVLVWLAADAWAGRWGYSLWRPISAERAATLQALLDTGRDDFDWSWPSGTRIGKYFEFPAFAEYVAREKPRSVRLTTLEGATLNGSASVGNWEPRHVLLKVDAPTEGRVTVVHFYYPGWTARVRDSRAELPLRASNEDAFIQFDVPGGTHEIALDLERQTPERWGIYISLASLAILAGLALQLVMSWVRLSSRTGR
jgi:hypothetical protein